MKTLSTLALASGILFLTSCRSSDTEQSLSGGTAAVNINLTGTDYAEDNSNLVASTSKTNITDTEIQSHSVLVTPSTVFTASIMPTNNQLNISAQAGLSTVAAAPGTSLGPGMKFRVIVYKTSDGSYLTSQDYTVGQPGTPFNLDGGVAYNFVTYSYGTSTLPAITTGEQTNISSAVVNYDDANRDFMYQNLSYTPYDNGGTNVLNIKLRHKITQLTPIVYITTFPSSQISAISNAVFTPHFSNGTIPLSTGNITGRSTSVSQPVTFSGPYPGAKQTGNPILVNADTGGNKTGSFSADITVGTVTKNIAFNNAFAIKPENTGNLNLRISTCGAYTASGVWKEFMCHNLGADTTADPFTAAAAIHGAKYQWGSNGVIRFMSQADDQANSGAIPGWNTSTTGANWGDGSKGSYDPCPSGYRVPSQAELTGIVNTATTNGTITRTGTWATTGTDAVIYGSGINIGGNLFLPAAGYRNNTTGGSLVNRGKEGRYWSGATVSGIPQRALFLDFTNTVNTITDGGVPNGKTMGYSLRCISQ